MDEKGRRVVAQNLGFIANRDTRKERNDRRIAEYRAAGNNRAADAITTRDANDSVAVRKAAQTVRNLVEGKAG